MTDDFAPREESRGARREPRPRRADARANRLAVLTTVAEMLRTGAPLTMRDVAARAGVGRATLYRHFPDPAALQRALQHHTLGLAAEVVEPSLAPGRPPLAAARSVVSSLVEVGAQSPLEVPIGPLPDEAFAGLATLIRPLAERLAGAARLQPVPDGCWLRAAIAHFAETALTAGWRQPDEKDRTAERLLRAITEPLDRGLLVLDADGTVVAVNDEGSGALATVDAIERGRSVVLSDGDVYEDGSPATPDAHPLNAALATGAEQAGVRGHRSADGMLRWYSIDVHPLRRVPNEVYGYVAVLTDITQEKDFELGLLRPAGQLRALAPPLLDVLRALDEIPPPLLPEQLVAEAMRLTGGPAALYVLDIDGSHLLRLAGREDFPMRLKAPLALGPELAEDGLPELAAHLSEELPGVAMAPMWLRGRAVGLLLAMRNSQAGLREVARLGAAALELANGYTDVVDAARRRKDMNPAAEIQQSLIPPRIVRMSSGELAGSVLPSYDVGGDWFDYVENRDGAWIAIADAAGKGPQAGGLGSVGLAALRAARRNGATLEQAAQTMHETMSDVGGPEFFLTVVLARWSGVYSVLSWINCGHPPPLLIRADGIVEELATRPDLPLGIFDRVRDFHRHQRRLVHGDRLVLYSDGISRRRTSKGLFGVEGIARAAREATRSSATATARAIQEAVVSASEDPLPDDAAVVVLAVDTPGSTA